MPGTTSGRGPSGPRRWPAPTRTRLTRRAARFTRRSPIARICNGSPHEQWAEARRRAWPVRVFGDLPFMISADSPDVWARQREFRFDATIGVPPDAFSETGQDWGLPPWRAHVMREGEFRWMQHRARRYAGLYDGYRIDHLVGLYRMYVRPIDKSRPAFFEPANEAAQTRLGETLVNVLRGHRRPG